MAKQITNFLEAIVCLENLVRDVERSLCGAKETNSYAQNVDILCIYHRTRAKEGKVQSVQPVEDLHGLTEDVTHVVLISKEVFKWGLLTDWRKA